MHIRAAVCRTDLGIRTYDSCCGVNGELTATRLFLQGWQARDRPGTPTIVILEQHSIPLRANRKFAPEWDCGGFNMGSEHEVETGLELALSIPSQCGGIAREPSLAKGILFLA